MSDIVRGDWVEVLPVADIPPMSRGGKPTRGRVEQITGDDVEIWVPIGDADVDDHSQACIYSISDLRRPTEGDKP